ncbi:MAG: HD-GYP domain-containing protein [Bacillota bacterium]
MLSGFSTGFRLYVSAAGLAAALSLVAASAGIDPTHWPHLLFFCLMLVIAEVVPLGDNTRGSVNFGPSVDIAGIMLFGPGAAGWVCLVGRAAAAFVLKESTANPYPKEVSFYKISHVILAIRASGAAYIACQGGFVLEGGTISILAVAAMTLAYFATLGFLSAVAYSIRYRSGLALFREKARLIQVAVSVPGALIFGLTYHHMQVGLSGVLLFLLFLLLVSYSSRLFVDMKAIYWGTVRALMTSVEGKAPHSVGHGDSVALYAVATARKMNMPENEVAKLHWAGFLHDIGLVGIHELILQKEGPLSVEEFEAVMEHPEKAYDMLREVPFLGGMAESIRYHHERYDGRGYPHGIAGSQIPISARILAVADVYDALVSPRSYRWAFPPEDARREVERLSGSAFDPKVIRSFLRVLDDEARWGRLVFHRHYSLDSDSSSRGRATVIPRKPAPTAD